jgi:iron complex outermembrane receptor protein
VNHLMTRPLLFVLFGAIAVPSTGFAQGQVPDLSQVSLEDLMNIEITSASRKEQRAADVPAAVFVITRDDIRRSGMTTIPDLLRLAPGVDVAQINSNKWAVSVRGFNALYANKLLVLVDGRSVYNKIFSGVLWDTEDLALDDIDRIEVIRGPGAATWGANAVNAVINIVTKASAGTRANDASHSETTGFRADWTTEPAKFMLEGDYTAGQARALWPNFSLQTASRQPIADDPTDTQGGHLLGRWTHTRASGASLQIQSFVDFAGRQEPVGGYKRRAFDVDTQYRTSLGVRHDVVAGAGYRFIRERFDGNFGLSLNPAQDSSSLLTAFMQDEIALLGKRLAVTLGTQAQYDSDSGAGLQPTARVMWKAFPRQRLWAAASRALRTPSLQDVGVRLDYPPVPTAIGLPLFVSSLGNPAQKTETLVDAEAGYRLEIGTAASIDVTGFMGRYDHLLTREVAAPVVEFVPFPHIVAVSQNSNLQKATTRGLEVAGHWAPVPAWRFDSSYSAFHIAPHPAATSLDPFAAHEDGTAPRAQWQVRSMFSPISRATLNVMIFHVGRLEQLNVAAYTRADVSAEWRFTSRLSAMAIGQNLLDAAHAEFGGTGSVLLPTQVPRSASLRLRWTSR